MLHYVFQLAPVSIISKRWYNSHEAFREGKNITFHFKRIWSHTNKRTVIFLLLSTVLLIRGPWSCQKNKRGLLIWTQILKLKFIYFLTCWLWWVGFVNGTTSRNGIENFQEVTHAASDILVIHEFSANAHHFSAENTINSTQDFFRVQKPCSSIERKYFKQLPMETSVLTFR